MVHQEVLPEGPKDSFGTDNPLTSDLWLRTSIFLTSGYCSSDTSPFLFRIFVIIMLVMVLSEIAMKPLSF